MEIACAAFVLERGLEEKVLYSILVLLSVGVCTITLDRGGRQDSGIHFRKVENSKYVVRIHDRDKFKVYREPRVCQR